jgi:regulator of extracellular matrix RemA (YlzA/DUF370 family)
MEGCGERKSGKPGSASRNISLVSASSTPEKLIVDEERHVHQCIIYLLIVS